MESKALDSALKATNVAINPADEISTGDRKKKAEEGRRRVWEQSG